MKHIEKILTRQMYAFVRNGLVRQVAYYSSPASQPPKTEAISNEPSTPLVHKQSYATSLDVVMPSFSYGFNKRSEHHQKEDRRWTVSSALTLVGWTGLIGTFMWNQFTSDRAQEIVGEPVNPIDSDKHGGNALIRNAADFERVGNKENGRMQGNVLRDVHTSEHYVEKSMPNRKSLLNEVVVGEFMHLVRGDDAPNAAILQSLQEGGQARFTVLSQILGHNQPGREAGRDLERMAQEYGYAEYFRNNPLEGIGVSVALDMMLGKTIDTKLANLVAMKVTALDGQSRSHVYSIDHECGFNGKPGFSLEPTIITNCIKDISQDFGDKLNHSASKLGRQEAGVMDDDEVMPLKGTKKAVIMHGIVLQSITEELPQIAKLYQKVAATTPEQIEGIIERLDGLLSDKEKVFYRQQLGQTVQQAQAFVAANHEIIDQLAAKADKTSEHASDATLSFVEQYCSTRYLRDHAAQLIQSRVIGERANSQSR